MKKIIKMFRKKTCEDLVPPLFEIILSDVIPVLINIIGIETQMVENRKLERLLEEAS